MIFCVTIPVTAITNAVVAIVIIIISNHIDLNILKDDIMPTAEGINSIGIISSKKSPVSFICSILTIPKHSKMNRMTMPYIFAGIGKGI